MRSRRGLGNLSVMRMGLRKAPRKDSQKVPRKDYGPLKASLKGTWTEHTSFLCSWNSSPCPFRIHLSRSYFCLCSLNSSLSPCLCNDVDQSPLLFRPAIGTSHPPLPYCPKSKWPNTKCCQRQCRMIAPKVRVDAKYVPIRSILPVLSVLTKTRRD